jgi:PilZ domain-containing protein
MAEATYAIKRNNPRYPFFADAEITLPDGTSLPAQLSELSARGCYVDTLEPVPIGTNFHLSIWEALNTCEVDGKVIYEHSGGGLGVIGMGVLFQEMPAEQHSKIDGWLTQLAGNREKAQSLHPEIQSPS